MRTHVHINIDSIYLRRYILSDINVHVGGTYYVMFIISADLIGENLNLAMF